MLSHAHDLVEQLQREKRDLQSQVEEAQQATAEATQRAQQADGEVAQRAQQAQQDVAVAIQQAEQAKVDAAQQAQQAQQDMAEAAQQAQQAQQAGSDTELASQSVMLKQTGSAASPLTVPLGSTPANLRASPQAPLKASAPAAEATSGSALAGNNAVRKAGKGARTTGRVPSSLKRAHSMPSMARQVRPLSDDVCIPAVAAHFADCQGPHWDTSSCLFE